MKNNTIPTERKALRGFISDTCHAIAAKRGQAGLRGVSQVMADIGMGGKLLSALVSEGTMDELRTAATRMVSLLDGSPEELPPPPPEISVVLDEPEAEAESEPEPEPEPEAEADDELDEAVAEAQRLAKAAAAAAARAGKLAASGGGRMSEADRKLLSALDSALAVQRDRVDRVETALDSLSPILDAIKSGGGSLPPRTIVAAKAAVSGDRLLKAVLPFFTPGLPQGNQIPCVASPPSFGKSFMSDEIGRLYDSHHFHPFKDSLDEIDSLVGTLMPRADGTFAVIDGPLVSAARSAAAGVNTLFVGDEIFNASKKTLEWMQSFLSPRLVTMADGSRRRCFVIQTKHSMEDGTFEVLQAPEECLHFLFLGNLRTNPPEALMSRCRLMRFDYQRSWAFETALQRLHQYSGGLWDESDASVKAWAEAWATAMTASRELHSRMEVSRPLCFRFLIGAVTHVSRQPDASLDKLAEYVVHWAPHQCAVQNAATQDTDTTSADAIRSVVSTAFSSYLSTMTSSAPF